MPRIPRGLVGGGVAHVLNRGNARATVFHSPSEYYDFVGLLDEARKKFAVQILAFCLMPNHFHLVTQTGDGAELSALMQWWLTSHVRRHHKRLATSGHVWQGRFKSFPVQEDNHLLTVLRYVLRNPVRARLVQDPWEWRWSSLWFDELVSPWPVLWPGDMRRFLAGDDDDERDSEIKDAIRRGAPYGDERWRHDAAERWGLAATLNGRGRPGVPDIDVTPEK